jgi:hypothetical protein
VVGCEPTLTNVSVYDPELPATRLLLLLLNERNGAFTTSVSIAQPIGVWLPVQAAALAALGAGLSGSPPPPTRARLTIASPLAAVTFTVNAKLLVPEAEIDAALVHVTTLLAATQLQFAACAPVSATAPSGMLS